MKPYEGLLAPPEDFYAYIWIVLSSQSIDNIIIADLYKILIWILINFERIYKNIFGDTIYKKDYWMYTVDL